MKPFEWNKDKNETLKQTRGVSFEDVVEALTNDQLITEFLGEGQYAHQKYYVLEINNYPHTVPYVEDDEKIFLKTIFPDRRYKHLISD
jgi:uncharacterized DUF497 family protein